TRELLLRALGLLHGQQIHIGPLQPGGDAFGTGTHGVDVPGRESHGMTVSAPSVTYGREHDRDGPAGLVAGQERARWLHIPGLSRPAAVVALGPRAGSPGRQARTGDRW